MGRPKKSAYSDYAKAEVAAEEKKADDFNDEFLPEETVTPDSDGIDEALELNTNPETTEPEKEKSLQEIEDEAFMEEITEPPKKLTPAQRARKITELEEDIQKTTLRMSEIESIADLAKSEGFRKLVEEVKGGIHGLVDEEDVKESAKSLKALDAVLTTERLVSSFNFQFNSKKADIKKWESDIVELKAGQLTIFEGGKADEVEASNIEASTVQEKEFAAVG